MNKYNMPNYVAIEEMAADIQRVADENELEVRLLGIDKYKKLGGKFRSNKTWDRKGGFAKIRNTFFGEIKKDLSTISKIQETAGYIKKLESQVGKKLSLEEQVQEVVKNLKVKLVPAKKSKLNYKQQLKGEKTQIVAMLNDLHYGMQVDPEENGNLNRYTFEEAGRRTAMFILQVADYKRHKRNLVEKLHLILNGDLIEGILRGGLGNNQDLLTHQVNGAVHILLHAIEYLKQEFPEIELHCLAGNHDRMTHKELGQRPTIEAYDSYANIIYYTLSAIYKKDKNIKFSIPKSPYGFIDLPSGRLMYLHGDGLFKKQLGNPSKTVNAGALGTAIREFNAGEIAKGNKPVKMVLFGHMHGYIHFITTDGVEVCGAPSLCGINGYAHLLNINTNLIAQLVFETTKDHIFGDSRLVHLNAADKNKSLDKIIPIFDRGLKCQK